jgi:hypothetical protein
VGFGANPVSSLLRWTTMEKGTEKKLAVEATTKSGISFERVLKTGSRVVFTYNREEPDFRANIGVRNPFIIARRLAKPAERNELNAAKTPEDLKTVISEIFERSKDLTYQELFDPKSGSPLYYGMYTKTKNLSNNYRLSWADRSILRNEKELAKNVDFYTGFYEHCLQFLKKDPGKVGAEPSFCAAAQKSSAQYSKIKTRNSQYRNTTLPNVNDGLEFNDPAQGCIADCWLISALSSIAWAEQVAGFPKKLSRTANQPSFWAFDPQGQWKRYLIPVNPAYYLDGPDPQPPFPDNREPYYARTNPYMDRYIFYESWGPCYEKACAAFWERNKQPPFPNPVDNPDYGRMNYNSPLQALMDITGLSYTNSTFYTSNWLPVPQPPPYDVSIVDKLLNDICGSTGFDPFKSEEFFWARRPAVAYTYYSDTYVPPSANYPNFPDTVTYDCAGMAANHAFSILGVYQERNDGIISQFVVLRNPWGDAGEQGDFDANLQNALATRLQQAINASGIASKIIYYTNLGEEGIFAFRSDYFMRYFEAFGWV